MKKAFAFIELLVDLAVILILTSIIIIYYKNMQDEIRQRIARQQIRMLKVAITSYYENMNPPAYPPATESLCADYLLVARPQIIKDILYDPFSKVKKEYRYAISPSGKYYCIWSIGKNRKSDIYGIDDGGNVIKGKRCDDLYATAATDPNRYLK